MDALDLAPGERIVARLQRNLAPYWMMLAVAGMALVVYAVTDEVFGWGLFFLGVVVLAFLGSALSSTRYVVTDRRLIRTGWLGRREVALGTLRAEPGAFGETLVAVGEDGASLRVRHVRNAAAALPQSTR